MRGQEKISPIRPQNRGKLYFYIKTPLLYRLLFYWVNWVNRVKSKENRLVARLLTNDAIGEIGQIARISAGLRVFACFLRENRIELHDLPFGASVSNRIPNAIENESDARYYILIGKRRITYIMYSFCACVYILCCLRLPCVALWRLCVALWGLDPPHLFSGVGWAKNSRFFDGGARGVSTRAPKGLDKAVGGW